MLQDASFRALAEHVAGRVHPSVAGDAAAAERHRDVILTHLAVGAAPFAALPVLLAFGAAPSALGLSAFAGLTVPVVLALDLSRSGALDRSIAGVAVAFGLLIATVAATTGGAASPALALLALPLIDAALAGARLGRRAAAWTAAAAAMFVAGLTATGRLPSGLYEPAIAAAAGVAAAVYALALAARAASALRAADRARRPGDRQLELMAGATDDLMSRHAANGAVVFASPAARELLGAAPRDLLGQGLFERVHIADRPAYLQALGGACDDGAPQRREIRLRRARDDGQPAFIWTEMRARRVRAHEVAEDTAASAPVIATFRDVAARRAHEEELVAAREEAERASLAKTRFLAHMSHELRTPLNAIIGFSEVLSDETLCRLTPERRADYAALIHRSGAHLLEVVNSILDMAKIESGAFAIAPRPCALEPLVAHCVSLMALKAETAGVALGLEAAPDLADVEADPRAVTQVALNLIANAIKFTPRGGAVTAALTPGRDGVVLTVRDTGVGIAPEHLGRLGEAFFQAEDGAGRRQEGAGLGLSVVRGLVALHGGEVAVESVLGRGTSVSVFLPARAVADPNIASAPVEKVRRRA